MKILKRSSSTENPVDTHYKGLDIDMEPLDKSDADFKVSSFETQYKLQYSTENAIERLWQVIPNKACYKM